MGITPATRKPVRLLTTGDFSLFPIWEYADDEEAVEGRDETWVRPVHVEAVPSRSYTIVSADFEGAAGRRFGGYVFVSRLESEPDVCQGVIWSGSAGLFVANPDVLGYESSRAELLRSLGIGEQELFPLSFRLLVPVEGMQGRWSGVLP